MGQFASTAQQATSLATRRAANGTPCRRGGAGHDASAARLSKRRGGLTTHCTMQALPVQNKPYERVSTDTDKTNGLQRFNPFVRDSTRDLRETTARPSRLKGLEAQLMYATTTTSPRSTRLPQAPVASHCGTPPSGPSLGNLPPHCCALPGLLSKHASWPPWGRRGAAVGPRGSHTRRHIGALM